MHKSTDPFGHAESTANLWLAAVHERLGAGDRRASYRMLRAWLHAVRDRVTVETAAHFAAQLPELLRGVYYEGWNPAHVPVRYDLAEFIERFATEAGISQADVPWTAATITSALRGLCSPGQVEHVLVPMPLALWEMLTAPTGADSGGG